jgi:hypothetical protein
VWDGLREFYLPLNTDRRVVAAISITIIRQVPYRACAQCHSL